MSQILLKCKISKKIRTGQIFLHKNMAWAAFFFKKRLRIVFSCIFTRANTLISVLSGALGVVQEKIQLLVFYK